MSFDFDAAVNAPFRMQPGLRRLEPGAKQLTPSRPAGRHLREKLAVLSSYPSQALLAAPGFDAGPALQALTEQAAAEHPDALRIGELPEVRDCIASLPPEWRRAGLLSLAFEEDFAIVDGANATIPWLAVALPSHWAPETKVGRPFAEVHAPVADNRLIVGAAGHLTKLVTGVERWERFVWTITRHPRLHAHPARLDPAPWPASADADTIAAIASWRTERQTFIPLPEHRQAVFTIHVQLQPLAEAMTPERAARVHDALASMSDAVLAYRGLAPVRDRLLDWLARRAGA
jgi:hypothetical protein